MKTQRLLLSLFCICFYFISFSQPTTDAVVAMSAEVDAGTPTITINWELNGNTADILMFRREKDSLSWFIYLDTLGTDMTSLVDPLVEVGKSYEYGIQRTVNGVVSFGFMTVAVEASAREERGKILVFVEAALEDPLAMELERLERDMIGDGWQVIWHSVEPDATVATIKDQIVADYNNDPDNVKQVFLLGEIPVPYSGDTNWDGHGDHRGAWASDTYYGDIDGVWTDNVVNNTTPSRPANDNIPGDGKFDQSIVPSATELAVGRVDFHNLMEGTFGATHEELLRRYLDKNHKWRTKKYTVSNQALVDDNFGYFQGEAFAANGYRNFYPLVGKDNVVNADFFSDSDDQSWLYGYACGGGSYVSAAGVGHSNDFANDSVNIAFTMIFGSYHGDWDSEDNPFMVSALASRGGILSCSWAGRPHWFNHHFASGETLGYCTVETQNTCDNPGYPNYFGACGSHVTLLGDPTLRAHVVDPISDLTITTKCNSIDLAWNASNAPNNLGYHVYRASEQNGVYTRLTVDPIEETTFTDNAPLLGNNAYQVRAMVLEETPSGSYYNMSTGVISNTNFTGGDALDLSTTSSVITCTNAQSTLVASSDAVNPIYEWSGPNGFSMSGQTILVTGSGDYMVTVTDQSTGCTAEITETVIADVSLPEANPQSVGILNCWNQTVSIAANPVESGYFFDWSGPDNFQSSEENIDVTVTGTYTLIVTNNSNGCSDSFDVDVNEDLAEPTADAGNNGELNCTVGMVTLDGNGSSGANLTYSWTTIDGNLVAGSETPTPVVNACGTYTLTVTNNVNGCTSVDMTEVFCDFTFADISIDGDFEILCNEPATLMAISSISDVQYEWAGPGITDPTQMNQMVTEPGQYSVLVTNNANGCVSSANVVVTPNTDIPQANPEAGGSFSCIQTLVQLVANPSQSGLEIEWVGPNNFMSNEENPIVSEAGTYTVTVTDPNNDCSSSANVTVLSDTTEPTADAGNTQTINCTNSAVTLDGGNSSIGPNIFYQWATFDGNILSGETTLNPVVDACGFYTLIVTNAENGCSSMSEVLVNCDIEIPDLMITGETTIPCEGDIVTLEATSSASNALFTWDGLGVTDPNNPIQTISSGGTYSVSVLNIQNGCTASESFTVTSNPPLVVDFISTIDCDGFTTPNLSISGGVGPYSMTYSPNPPFPPNTTYNIVVSDFNGCTEMISGTTPNFDPLTVSISHIDETILGLNDGSATAETMFGVPPFVFEWSTGATTQAIENLAPGEYTVTVTDASGCIDMQTVEILEGMVSTQMIEGLQSFSIFPNPSNGQFNVKVSFDNPKNLTLEILDITGRIIQFSPLEKAKEKQWSVDISNFASGLYLVKVKADGEFLTERILKDN